jgi:membrane protease YdiL (CAAX protease family)
MAVVVEGGLVLVGMFAAWIFGARLADQLPADGGEWLRAIGRGVLATVPMLVAFWLLIHSKQPGWRELRKQVESLLRELFPSRSVSQFALVAVLAGVGEELLFRGVLQTLFIRWTTLAVGLAAASLLFGLAHAFLLATVIGLYLGGLVLLFDDLATAMVAHALYDFVALVYLSRNQLPR